MQNKMLFRVGQGYDCHVLVVGRPLIIGGVIIPYDKGLLGHSDALLGAAGLGDIGQHFSDKDPQFYGVDSRILLREAMRRVSELGYRVGNVDATVIAEQPKMASYLFKMVENIAYDLNIENNAVNIKAKTNEKLGYLGRGEAMEAQAIVLIYQNEREG
jgi:2-C-methyl-D-erythritol 2,4-cyclodiphosphate synthase